MLWYDRWYFSTQGPPGPYCSTLPDENGPLGAAGPTGLPRKDQKITEMMWTDFITWTSEWRDFLKIGGVCGISPINTQNRSIILSGEKIWNWSSNIHRIWTHLDISFLQQSSHICHQILPRFGPSWIWVSSPEGGKRYRFPSGKTGKPSSFTNQNLWSPGGGCPLGCSFLPYRNSIPDGAGSLILPTGGPSMVRW